MRTTGLSLYQSSSTSHGSAIGATVKALSPDWCAEPSLQLLTHVGFGPAVSDSSVHKVQGTECRVQGSSLVGALRQVGVTNRNRIVPRLVTNQSEDGIKPLAVEEFGLSIGMNNQLRSH